MRVVLVELTSVSPVGGFLIFIYGALIGSFINVVIYRCPLERSIVVPGSGCGTCGTPLRWWENIPILAYFLLGGRCATCGTPYSWRYAALETLTALAAVCSYLHYEGLNLQSLYAFIFFCLLLVVFFTDYDHWIILDSVTYGGMAVGVVGGLFMPLRQDFQFFDFYLLPASWLATWGEGPWLNVVSSLYGMILGASFYWAIQILGGMVTKQEAMGSGDIKLAAMIGSFLGWSLGLCSFFLSFILGALVAGAMLLGGGRRGKDPLPLGTFMAIAAWVVFWLQGRFWDWLWQLTW